MKNDFDGFFAQSGAQPPAPVDAAPTSEFDDFFKFQRDTQKQAAQDALNGAIGAKPDEVGKAMTVGPQVGMPSQVVETDIPSFEDQLRQQRAVKRVENNPAIASWLAGDADRARVAIDDFDNLDMVSKLLTAIGGGIDESFTANERARAQYDQSLTGQDRRVEIASLDKRIARTPQLAGTYGFIKELSGFAGGLFDNFLHGIDDAAVGMASGAAIGAAATPEALGVGAVPGAVAGFGVGLLHGMGMDQAMVSGGQTYQALEGAVDDGGRPVDPAAKHMAATGVALAAYAMNYVGGEILWGSAQKAMSAAVVEAVKRPTVARALAGFGKELGKAGIEGAALMGAFAATQVFAEEFAKQYSSDDFATIFNDQAARADAGQRLIQAMTMGAVFMPFAKLPFEMKTLAHDMTRVRQAQADASLMQSLGKTVEASKVRTRNMDAFQAFAREHLKGGPIEEVGVPVEAVVELYQSLKIEPGADDGVLGAVASDIAKQIEQAKATGGDIRLNLDAYTAKLAGSDIWNALSGEIRFRPEGMTLRESTHYEKMRGQLLEDNAVEFNKTMADAAKSEEGAAAVYEDVLGKLRRAGYTLDAATQVATLWASRYRARAERLGDTDALELYDNENITIRRELPPTVRRVGIDRTDMLIEAIRRGEKLPSDRRIYGPTLIEFIKKNGGVFDYAGELKSRDLHKTKGFVRSAKKGGDKEQYGLDGVTRAAWEAGYFPEHGERPEINDLLNAIDDELSGSKRYQYGTDRESEALFKKAVEELDDFLGQNDIDVKKTSNAKIKKLLAAKDAEAKVGTVYEQNTVPTETANFRKWFKQSAVVDAEGKPLRVYHGTVRADRVAAAGKFLKSRATSGPMSFFTTDPALASSYSTAKGDNSLGDEPPYHQQFKIKDGRSKLNLYQYWYSLSGEEKARVRDLARKVHRDDDMNIVLDETNTDGPGGLDFAAEKMHGGNYLMGLSEQWLSGGILFGEEHKFLEVLKLVGLKGFEYEDHHATQPGVVPVYLSIQNPLISTAVPQAVIDDLRKAARRQREPEYKTGVDQWDKRARSPREWIEHFNQSLGDPGTYAFTVVPDWVTKVLKKHGFDGIRDVGGKGGGVKHDVWIPFEEPQVKSVFNKGAWSETDGRLLYQSSKNPGATKTVLEALKEGETPEAAFARVQAKHPDAKMIPATGEEPGGTQYVRAKVRIADLPKSEQPDAWREFNQSVVERKNREAELEKAYMDALAVEKEAGAAFDKAKALGPDSAKYKAAFERALKAGKTATAAHQEFILASLSRKDRDAQSDERMARVRAATYEGLEGDFAKRGEANAEAKAAVAPADEQGGAVPMAGDMVAAADGKVAKFRTQKEAARWIVDVGHKSASQAFEIANHPDGDGFAAKALRELSQGAKGEARRGSIRLEEGRSIISLFKDSDLSTILHEGGHQWLEEFRRDYLDVLSRAPDAAGEAGSHEQLKADFETVMKWLGMDAPGEITVEQHEQFARGMEAYFYEGKAPTAALARAFKAFKQWLVRIYRDIAGLNVPMNDEIRGVFDRLLATEDELAAAKESLGANPAFATAKDAGMTDAEFAGYTAQLEKAQQKADETLLGNTMAAVRARREKEWRGQFKEMRDEVKSVVTSRRDLRAEHWLRTGKMIDGSKPEGIEHARLSQQYLAEMYGHKGMLDMLPEAMTAKDGAHPDTIATLFGYRTGDELVSDLIEMEGQRKAEAAVTGKSMGGNRYVNHIIDRETNERMLDRHGDALNDGSIEQEAIDALHNQARLEVLGTELRAIGKRAGRMPVDVSDIEAWVDGQVSEMPIARARSETGFLRNEGQAGKETQRALLKGDVRGAFMHKQRQIVNAIFARAAKKAAADYESAMKLFTRYAKKAEHKGLDAAYVDQIHALLKRIGFQVKRQDAELAAGLDGTTLREFIDGKRADGYELVAAEYLLDPLFEKPVADMTMGELRDVDDMVRSLVNSARVEKQMILEGKKQDFELLKEEAIATLEKQPQLNDPNVKGGIAIRSPRVGKGTVKDKARAALFRFTSVLADIDSYLRKTEELVDILDGEQSTGVFNRVLFKPIAEREHWAADRQREITNKWVALRDGMSDAWKRSLDSARVVVPELRKATGEAWSFSKGELLMIANNLGARSNLDKMLKGEFWDEASVRAALDRLLTKEDWQFVQSTLDIVNSLWPEIDAQERRLTGLGPDKVEAMAIPTKYGPLKGGYFPMMYDASLSIDTAQRVATAETKLFDLDYQRATTPRGHTKRRVEGYARELDYNFGRVAQHLESVIHDLAYREVIMQADKFIRDKDIRAGIVKVIGKEAYQQLHPWLKSIANATNIDARDLKTFDWICKSVRINATMVGMGFRVKTMLAQLAGLGDSTEIVGGKGMRQGIGTAYGAGTPLEFLSKGIRLVSETKAGKMVGAEYLAKGYDAITGSQRKFNRARTFVVERSGEVRNRFETIDRDMRQGMKELLGKKGVLTEGKRMAYMGIALMDQAVVVPTWIGAYKKALSEGKAEADAIYYADKVVRLSQGSGSAKDLAPVARQSNPEWFKLATMFYSYFSHLYNRMAKMAGKAKSGVKAAREGNWMSARKDFGAAFTRFFWLCVVPPLSAKLITGGGPQEGEDVAGWALRTMTFNLFGGVPIVRDVSSAVEFSFVSGQQPDYKFSPAERAGSSILKNLSNIEASFDEDRDVSDKWLRDAIEGAGYLGGLPGAGQFGTSSQYLLDLSQGDRDADTMAQFVGELVLGPKPEKK